MLQYFVSNVIDRPARLFLGQNDGENQFLIRHSHGANVIFRVHGTLQTLVYLEMKWNSDSGEIDEDLLFDCCQLAIDYSPETWGNVNWNVFYTSRSNCWENGRFRDMSEVKMIRIKRRCARTINRLTNTGRTMNEDRFMAEQLQLAPNTRAVQIFAKGGAVAVLVAFFSFVFWIFQTFGLQRVHDNLTYCIMSIAVVLAVLGILIVVIVVLKLSWDFLESRLKLIYRRFFPQQRICRNRMRRQ